MAKKSARKPAKVPKQAAVKRKPATKTKARKKVAKKASKKVAKKVSKKVTQKTSKKVAGKPIRGKKTVLLSGGNPQIAKAEGDAPVQAYIAAMPEWKRDVGRRLDALIQRAVPGVQKSVRWNSPFYGVKGKGWILSFHCFTKYIKVTFFSGGSLRPLPPGVSKHKEVRYLDIYEGQLDEKQFVAWVKQASRLPGWLMGSVP